MLSETRRSAKAIGTEQLPMGIFLFFYWCVWQLSKCKLYLALVEITECKFFFCLTWTNPEKWWSRKCQLCPCEQPDKHLILISRIATGSCGLKLPCWWSDLCIRRKTASFRRKLFSWILISSEWRNTIYTKRFCFGGCVVACFFCYF